MLVNLSDCLMSEGKEESMLVDMEKTDFSYRGSVYRIQDKTPLSLKVSNIAQGKARLEGRISLKLVIPCDRCLKDVVTAVEMSFDRLVYAPESAGLVSGDDLADEEADGQDFLEGYQLDVEKLLDNEIFLNFPTKVLCRGDCKGICKVCGKDLNTGDCGCDTFVPDPRMAKIKDIFQAGKEV